MPEKFTKLYDLIDHSDPEAIIAEIRFILELMNCASDCTIIEEAYRDDILLFNGNYPGYRASNTKYHDLDHTGSVTLALVRLIHGHYLEGKAFSLHTIILGILAALFHDTGLIQAASDLDGTGAKYTVGHEDRSIQLMRQYLEAKNKPYADIQDCTHIIMCTILDKPVAEIPFNSENIKLMGKIMGSADLIAQMADRLYLEKLPLLFMEFKEAGLPGYESPLELFANTEEFYHAVARKRLTYDLDNVAAAARSHFRVRWGIDRDLYADSINNNIKHIKETYETCNQQFDCVTGLLRRHSQRK